jgi:hypothetical protein
MKTVWNGELLLGMEELSLVEERAIAGGESLWFWVGYAVGLVANAISHSAPGQSDGQKLVSSALG